MAGSLYAIYSSKIKYFEKLHIKRFILDFLKISGILIIFFSIFFVSPTSSWPGVKAIAPVIGTLLVISATNNSDYITNLFKNRLLVGIGKISYPLYLYHWVFLTFALQCYAGSPPDIIVFYTLIFSVIAAILTYKYIEQPIRSSQRTTKLLVFLLALILGFGIIGYVSKGFNWRFTSEQRFNDLPAIPQKYLMTDNKCVNQHAVAFINALTPQRDFCRSSVFNGNVKILLVGDSHANQLWQAFDDLNFASVSHIGRSSCPPLWGFLPTEEWLKCFPIVNQLIEYAVHSDADLLILTGVFQRYFDGTYATHQTTFEIEHQISLFFKILASSKKEVLLILDNPVLPFDPKQCMQRPYNLNQRIDCFFSRSNHDKFTEIYKKLFEKNASKYKNIKILDSAALFCDNLVCYSKNEDGLTYNTDNNHLSMRGAKIIVNEVIKEYPNLFN